MYKVFSKKIPNLILTRLPGFTTGLQSIRELEERTEERQGHSVRQI